MSTWTKLSRVSIFAAIVLIAGCTTVKGMMGMGTKLSGSEEVPAVKTSASGFSDISIKDDRTVAGTASVSGMKPTAAHIHEAPAGKNGPVIIGLRKTSDTTFEVPKGAKLTDAQYRAFKAGNLYVNVHSAAHPGGEVRGQLKP